jgi:gamma-glutamylcyclotransferase (GGCT)/AIG2-like uncharacterized protein YtfP
MRLEEIDDETVIYYFAYGMLTDPEVMQGLDMVGKAILYNYAFEFAQFANIYPKAGSQVYGTLWAIDKSVLDELDHIESYPTFYTRHTAQVKSKGRTYTSQVYVMTSDSRNDLKGYPPSSHYLQRLARGYNHAGLPMQQIKQAQTAVLNLRPRSK